MFTELHKEKREEGDRGGQEDKRGKRIMIKLPDLKNIIIIEKKVRLGKEIVRNSEKMMPEQKALSRRRDPEMRAP